LLPGQHWFRTYGDDTTYFTVNADGTMDYDPTLDGVLSGRGTSLLTLNGRTISLNATALNGAPVYLDYTAFNSAAPLSVQLLPGQHFLYDGDGNVYYFTVNADGTIDYDVALDGVFSGRGTTQLVFTPPQ
jgi:hypothetical protein